MNIILLEDLPHKGKHWTSGQIVYNVDPAFFIDEIKTGKVKEYNVKEPVWKAKEKEEE